MMSTNNIFSAAGQVLENLPNTMFRVKISESDNPQLVGETILCTLSGKMRINWVRLLPGDKVKCEVSTLDTSKGRITYKSN
jgi:translation initiation factor IF-1